MAAGGVGAPVAAGLAQQIARWLRERGLGAGGTVVTPTPTPTPSPAAAVPEDGSAPVATATAATTGTGRTPQFPNPTSNVERMYNAAEQIQWQIEDVQGQLDGLTADTEYRRPKLQDDINTLLGRLTSQQQAIAAAERTAVDVSGRNPPKGETRTKVERAPAPDNRMFRITEVSDGYGGWSYQAAEPIEGSQPQGAAEDRAIDLARAQAQVETARLAVAQAQALGPVQQEQARVQLADAQARLEEARLKAPVDLAVAQTQLAVAQEALRKATSPEAQEQARLELDLARQNLDRARAPQVIPADATSPVIVSRNPTTGEVSTQPNPAYQGPTFQDATAAYNAQVPRLQQAARTERDRLLELQRSGAISEADAERQFSTWFGQHVETPLAGYRTAAEEAQRKEQRETALLQRAENARAEGLNLQREQLGYQAGEQARGQVIALAPQARTPEFLRQAGQSVAAMSARAGAKSAQEAAALPAGPRFSADAFDPATYAAATPDLDEVARAATQRALASISPAVAAQIGAPLPRLPTGPTLQSMLGQLPYRGPLSALPSPASGLLPTPGMEAVDLVGSRPGWARTHYGPTGGSFFDWQLPTG